MLNGETKVYVTRTGRKYHSEDCSYLYSCIEIDLSFAIKLYSACSRCNPPKPNYEGDTNGDEISNRSSKFRNYLINSFSSVFEFYSS
jgi:hypothetical protein